MLAEIKYQAIWGKLYILLGVLFALLFIFAALILSDYSIFINLIATVILAYIGYNMLKKPYASYSEKEIKVYGIFGTVRRHYRFTSKNEVQFRNNKLYIGSKKLQINHWMVNENDWKKLVIFFDPDNAFIQELKD